MGTEKGGKKGIMQRKEGHNERELGKNLAKGKKGGTRVGIAGGYKGKDSSICTKK